jgi:hypothetical protein
MSVDNKVKELSHLIAFKSNTEAVYFPIDRAFLKNYIRDILTVNKSDFLLCNLERGEITYSVMLLACLPELWEDIDTDDIVNIINKFTNQFSYYALVQFSYKFLEIDLIDLIMKMKTISPEIKSDLKRFLESQYPNLIKYENDFFLFQENIFPGLGSWVYIKQRLLLDKRIQPALQYLDELNQYVENLTY